MVYAVVLVSAPRISVAGVVFAGLAGAWAAGGVTAAASCAGAVEAAGVLVAPAGAGGVTGWLDAVGSVGGAAAIAACSSMRAACAASTPASPEVVVLRRKARLPAIRVEVSTARISASASGGGRFSLRR